MIYHMSMKPRSKQKNSRSELVARGGKASARRYREKMRRHGMRLVQFWAPDVGAPGFAQEARRQSRLASADKAHEKQILDEIAALSAGLDLGAVPDFVIPRGKA
jgi:hypothetical protein